MKIRNKKDAFVIGGLLAGTVMVLWGITNCLHSCDFAHCFLILVGLIMLGSALYDMRRPETEVLHEGRNERKSQRAGYIGGGVVLVSVTILLWADRIWSLNIEPFAMCAIATLLGIYSQSMLRRYYNRVEGK